MKKLSAILISLLVLAFQLSAQNMDEWVKESNPLLFEKLYLHVDREIYAPGDKIWLKLYHVNGITHQLNSNFRNVFVQLVAQNGRVVNDLLLFSADGQALGNFNTDTISDGMYTIRAFTRYLEKFGEEACFHKNIWIKGTKKSLDPLENGLDHSIREVDFLPEGGNLVLNTANTVAFKAIDQKGRGVDVSGKIMDDLGDTITSFKSSYRGMGKLNLMPVDERSYYAVVDQNPGMKISLPAALAEGINLSCKDNGESLIFSMSANMKMETHQPFYFMASHKGTVLYRKIELNDFACALNLNKDLFPEGISKITLLDTLKRPFAERLIYVDKREDIISLQLNKQEFKPREHVTIDAAALLEEGDSITAPLSVTVVNQNYFGTGGNSQTIKSYLLLDSELKGGIESPASYFTDDTMPRAQKLDLLMMVNGWRSYLWDEVADAKTAGIQDWNDVGIEINGYVKKLLWKAPLPDAEVSLGYVFKNFELGKTTTNQNGRFRFERIFFQDSTAVMLNGRTKNGTRNLEIILDPQKENDTFINPDLLKKASSGILLNRNFYQDNLARQRKILDFNPEKGIILLDEVDIVGDAKEAFTRSQGEYPWADRTFKVQPEDNHYPYLVDYLLDKIPSLVYSIDTFTMANRPVDFLIDNLTPMDLREITLMRMGNVDIIDVLNPGFRSINPGELGAINPNGLIAIYSKDPNKVFVDYTYHKGRIRPNIRGFHKPAKFYSPSYTLDNIDSPQPDYRPTLLWNPELSFQNGKASIDFFTSDEQARYVVFVEGVTKNGRICFATTDFVVDGK